MAGVAALAVGAGGFIHLREWLSFYRHVPAALPGSAVVRIGFPVHALASVLAVVVLMTAALVGPRLLRMIALGTLGFQAGAVAALLLSHYASLFGWSEPVWTSGTVQSLGAGAAALAALGAVALLSRPTRCGRPSKWVWTRR